MAGDLEIPIGAMTSGTLSGQGVFDVLMRTIKGHLDEEFRNNRVKGSEYANVYLGAIQTTLQTSLSFLIQGAKLASEKQLLEVQLQLAQVELQKAQVQLTMLEQGLPKVAAEVQLLQAQAGLAAQQKTNLQIQQDQVIAEVALANKKVVNMGLEGNVLVAQECKLKAEYDNLMLGKDRVVAETTLLGQKLNTEKAQTTSAGVDADSVIGRQKTLYQAQANGFTRDAEQKAAKLLLDTWNVRRTTDSDNTAATGVNKLDDATLGKAVQQLLTGIGVS